VRALRDRGDLTARHPAMRAVGYRQLWAHLDGAYDLAEAVQRGMAATRQLAKRQLTWMRREKQAQWLDPDREAVSGFRDISRELAKLGL
jgi:tRNA dimethylallyltransferase